MIKIIDKKNLLKSFLYRIYSFIITFFVTFLITQDVKFSITLGFLENIIKNSTYYFFDIFWDKITKKDYKITIIWFTGLSGSGKTTIAKEVLHRLQSQGKNAMLLDGDEIRDIFKNYGFDKNSRIKHIQDVAKMAVYLQKQGIIPIVSLISPYEEAREYAKKISDDFTEVYISTPIEICEKRDVKGLYKKVREGEIKNFTGVHKNSPYEIPKKPSLELDTTNLSVNYCVDKILKGIKK